MATRTTHRAGRLLLLAAATLGAGGRAHGQEDGIEILAGETLFETGFRVSVDRSTASGQLEEGDFFSVSISAGSRFIHHEYPGPTVGGRVGPQWRQMQTARSAKLGA